MVFSVPLSLAIISLTWIGIFAWKRDPLSYYVTTSSLILFLLHLDYYQHASLSHAIHHCLLLTTSLPLLQIRQPKVATVPCPDTLYLARGGVAATEMPHVRLVRSWIIGCLVSPECCVDACIGNVMPGYAGKPRMCIHAGTAVP